MSDTPRLRIECAICGMVEYFDDHLRADVPAAATCRAMLQRHKKIKGTTCDHNDWHYLSGVLLTGRKIVGQEDPA